MSALAQPTPCPAVLSGCRPSRAQNVSKVCLSVGFWARGPLFAALELQGLRPWNLWGIPPLPVPSGEANLSRLPRYGKCSHSTLRHCREGLPPAPAPELHARFFALDRRLTTPTRTSTPRHATPRHAGIAYKVPNPQPHGLLIRTISICHCPFFLPTVSQLHRLICWSRPPPRLN